MELGHLSYKKGTYEDYIGLRGIKRLGKKKWRRDVAYCVSRLIDASTLTMWFSAEAMPRN